MAGETDSTLPREVAEAIAAWQASIPPPPKRGKRPPVRELRRLGPIAFVPLTQGLHALIDVGDFDLVKNDNWYVSADRGTWYARRSPIRNSTSPTRILQLHRLIVEAPDGVFVDHINGNGLDCRRANLRLATDSQNKRNRPRYERNKTGFKGVCFVEARNKYQASIRVGERNVFLGRFDTPEEAFAAYSSAAAREHGEFLNLG